MSTINLLQKHLHRGQPHFLSSMAVCSCVLHPLCPLPKCLPSLRSIGCPGCESPCIQQPQCKVINVTISHVPKRCQHSRTIKKYEMGMRLPVCLEESQDHALGSSIPAFQYFSLPEEHPINHAIARPHLTLFRYLDRPAIHFPTGMSKVEVEGVGAEGRDDL